MRSNPGQLTGTRERLGPRESAPPRRSQNVLGAGRGGRARPVLSSSPGRSEQGMASSFCLHWNLIIAPQGCD